MSEGLKLNIPTLGWEQVLTGRKKILDEYDRARTQARGHEVEAYHGRAGEAAVREWLSTFLPKRYGVTSGYIISAGLDSGEKMPHYDVIIYDQLESPILWVESHGDLSGQGRSLAIPVEHVYCVLEVKAAMSSTTVKEAIKHLRELLPLMSAFDASHSHYMLYLPPTFCCGMVFIELRKTEEHSAAALEAYLEGVGLRGFFGGMVMRTEGRTNKVTGQVSLLFSEAYVEQIPLGRVSLSEFTITRSNAIGTGHHVAAQLDWTEHAFSRFGFDLIARMQGKYRPGYLSSFYGMGMTEEEVTRANEPRQ